VIEFVHWIDNGNQMFPDIEAIEAKAKQQGFDSLSKEERIVFVIAEAEFEINLGGV
jgi:hypothetical protein